MADLSSNSPTRETVLQALVALLFQRRYDTIRVADIIALANIGRSTFYDHFHSKDDVLLAVIEPILAALADSATGRTTAAELIPVVEHVWDQRAMGRLIFTKALSPRLERKLAAMIEQGLGVEPNTPDALIAAGLAAARLTMLRLWITGGAPSTAEALAKAMVARSL